MRLAFTYALLAAIATAVNILSQELALHLYGGLHAMALSVLVGTGAGLVVKYLLDKAYIFRFRAQNAIDDGQTFMLYTTTGIFTTIIFWGMEFGFDHLFGTKEARYTGAVIGLAIGYIVKYRLDRRFVFTTRTAPC